MATATKKTGSEVTKAVSPSQATKAAKTQAARLATMRKKIVASSKTASKTVPLTSKK